MFTQITNFIRPISMYNSTHSPPRSRRPVRGPRLGASKRLLDGKSVGSSLIRHMYLSSKYADTVQEMEKDADLMLHSPGDPLSFLNHLSIVQFQRQSL
eukprot:SAG22_NODE_4645_length_1206_cov_4.360434_1_plen_98_part_00